jgi:hypothetical protein
LLQISWGELKVKAQGIKPSQKRLKNTRMPKFQKPEGTLLFPQLRHQVLQALPSGNGNLSSSTKSFLKVIPAIIPKLPPIKTKSPREYGWMFMERIKKAGRVKAMAEAKDSPADAMVWTMLASRIVPLLRKKGLKLRLRRVYAETVIPAFKAR